MRRRRTRKERRRKERMGWRRRSARTCEMEEVAKAEGKGRT